MLRFVTRIRSWLMLTGQRFVLPPLWFLYRKDSRCVPLPMLIVGCHSIGNAAIFLLGGTTRDAEPIPILLRSGDAVIMSGPECRRAYHGQSMCPTLNHSGLKKIQRRPKNSGGYNATASRLKCGRAWRLGTLWPIHQDDEDQSKRSSGVPQRFPADLVTQRTNTSCTKLWYWV
jgi:hypothetical protein